MGRSRRRSGLIDTAGGFLHSLPHNWRLEQEIKVWKRGSGQHDSQLGLPDGRAALHPMARSLPLLDRLNVERVLGHKAGLRRRGGLSNSVSCATASVLETSGERVVPVHVGERDPSLQGESLWGSGVTLRASPLTRGVRVRVPTATFVVSRCPYEKGREVESRLGVRRRAVKTSRGKGKLAEMRAEAEVGDTNQQTKRAEEYTKRGYFPAQFMRPLNLDPQT